MTAWGCADALPRSEPWLIEGAEDVSSKPFVADDDDDDDAEAQWEAEQGEGEHQREDAFADWTPEPKARAGRR